MAAEERATFGRYGFILAAVGSAIGLGNIWKFPYITYENGGGSFVLVYLAAILLIGFPLLMAEIAIGRRMRKSAVGAYAGIGEKASIGGRKWGLLGGFGVMTGALLLSYYAIIAGWTVFYLGKTIAWSTGGFDVPEGGLGSYFGGFLAQGPTQLLFQGVFMVFTTALVALGVTKGIERFTKAVMPVLGVVLLLLAINSVRAPGFGEAMGFLFHIGPITSNALLEAVGHAFFTLSLGMAAMVTYGSYVGRDQSIPKAGLMIALFDTVIALLACVVMFSIIFGVPEIARAESFGRSATILFTALPEMFYDLPLGSLLAPIFYALVGLAALTSTISLLEVVVSYFVDQKSWPRKKAAMIVGGGVFLLGIPSAMSLGASEFWTNFPVVGSRATGAFSVVDYFVSNWFLPIGGLATAILAGWFIKAEVLKDELELGHGTFKWFKAWQFALRVIAPVAIIWILIQVVGGKAF